ncbi:hypothetical protein TD95_003123 [Thielaviopsis punctulata]|uniref:Uncharacterized protein n=1 Tax=Thielaviopsis punctulata TaxID=72032 RepID=A0A0F4Z6D6_9PEZI|nr:hypothetical protein TD95_003123 [Thielaviopsis punctulata]
MDNHRRPQTPTRPPEYMIPPYDEEPEHSPTNPAAMRLLTSTDEYDPNSIRRHQAVQAGIEAGPEVDSEIDTGVDPDVASHAGPGPASETGSQSESSAVPSYKLGTCSPQAESKEAGSSTEPQSADRPCGIPASSSPTKLVVNNYPIQVLQDFNGSANDSVNGTVNTSIEARANAKFSARTCANVVENQKSVSHHENNHGNTYDCDIIPGSWKIAPLKVPAIKSRKPVMEPKVAAHDAYTCHSPEKRFDPAAAFVPLLSTRSPRKSTSSPFSKLSNFAKSASIKLKKKASISAPASASHLQKALPDCGRDSPPSRNSTLAASAPHWPTAPDSPPLREGPESVPLQSLPPRVAPPRVPHPRVALFNPPLSTPLLLKPKPIRPPPLRPGPVFCRPPPPKPVFAQPAPSSLVPASSGRNPFISPQRMDRNFQWPKLGPRPVTCESLADEDYQGNAFAETSVMQPPEVMLPPAQAMCPVPEGENLVLPVLPQGSSPRRRQHQRMVRFQTQEDDDADTVLGQGQDQDQDQDQQSKCTLKQAPDQQSKRFRQQTLK